LDDPGLNKLEAYDLAGPDRVGAAGDARATIGSVREEAAR
jgi:hypothetical protein